MVYPTGFEPATYRVGVCHSIQLSYGYMRGHNYNTCIRVWQFITSIHILLLLIETDDRAFKNNKNRQFDCR